jgi:uncharacterized membrane protein
MFDKPEILQSILLQCQIAIKVYQKYLPKIEKIRYYECVNPAKARRLKRIRKDLLNKIKMDRRAIRINKRKLFEVNINNEILNKYEQIKKELNNDNSK